MNQSLAWFSTYATPLSIFGAGAAFVISTYLQTKQRQTEANEREFQNYHRLIKELVAPDPESRVTWIDRQAAVVFELRHFPRYYELTRRTLQGLKEKWTSDPEFRFPRLIEEVDLTLDYIKKK